jgi:Tfp pilus assembly protein PilX
MMPYRRHISPHESGAALTVVLGLLALLTLWGITTVTTTPSATRIAENDRQIAQYYTMHAQVFYAAEAGSEEARARLRMRAGQHRIIDNAPDDPTWGVAIETRGEGQEPALHPQHYERLASLQADLPYTVTIRHATRATDAAVLHWGDERGAGVYSRNTMRGANIYVITAYGAIGDARHTIEIEATPEPPPTVPAALYVAGPLHMHGEQTQIIGTDSCGEQHQAGVRTTLPAGAMTLPGKATITGVPPVASNSMPLHVQSMVDTLKERATIVYAPAASVSTTASPGEHWGTPIFGTTLQTPGTCHEGHIVHYDTHGTQGRLRPGTTGCGVLLVEGDVEIDGDFSWYGAILVTGSLHLTGGGSKRVTGGVVVAGAATVDAGTETSLIYCSEAIVQPTRSMPLRILTWRDILPTTH